MEAVEAAPDGRGGRPTGAVRSAAPASDGIPAGLNDGVSTLTELLERTVKRFASRPAVDFLGRRWTYREIGTTVARLAAGLRTIGVERGTRVGLCLPNTPYSVLFYFAVLRLGGTVVNFNPLYTSRECLAQIRDSGTTHMVVMDLERIYRPVASVAAEAGLRRLVVCPMSAILPMGKSLLFRLFKRRELARTPKDACHVGFAALLAAGSAPAPAESVDPGAVAVLQYTGGTTGVPKAAMLTHANLVANARQIVVHAGDSGYFRPGEDRLLGVLPLFHVFALTTILNLGVALGAELVLLPRFELKLLLATIRRARPTIFPGVPTLYGVLNDAMRKRRAELSSIRLCVSGGAPLPLEIRTRFESLTGGRLVEGYGLTETAPVVTANPLDGRAIRDGSAGVALPFTTIEIRDLDAPGRVLPAGEKGEICVRGPQVMAGYWNRPDETADVMVDGALRTGDVGYLDPDGNLFIVDRLKDLIICSGFNVYPRVIEEALYEHEAVGEAVVIGEPDPYRGERPRAFVTLKAGMSATPEALREFLLPRLSRIEMPVAVEIRDSLPKTMVGKLWKKALIEQEWRRRRENGERVP